MYDLFHRIFIRTMGYRLLVFSMLLMLLSPLAIADEMGADDQVIARILDRSGINQQFLQLPKILRMQLAQQPPPIAFSDAREFTEIVVSAVDPDKMQGDMTRYLRAHYEDSRYRKFLSLLEEPLVKKMTAMENAANAPESQRKMMQKANAFMSRIPPKRVALLREIDQAIKGAEFMVALNVKEFQTLTNALNPLLPEGQQVSKEQLESMSREIQAQSLYPGQQQMVLQMAWAYQGATDEELQRYLKTYRSDIGQWAVKLLMNATLAVFDGALERISTQIDLKILNDRST